MEWITPSTVIGILGTFMLFIIFAYLYISEREKFILIWAFGWLIFMIGIVATLLMDYYKDYHDLLFLIHQLSVLFTSSLIAKGSYMFIEKSMNKIDLYILFLGLCWIIYGATFSLPLHIIQIPTFFCAGGIFVWVGLIAINKWEVKGLSFYTFKISFILWGIHLMDYPFLKRYNLFVHWGFVLATALEFMVALSFVFMYFEKSKKDLIKIQNNLMKSESKLNTIIENQKDVIFELNSQGRFTFISPSCETILLKSVSKIIGKHISEVIKIDKERFFHNSHKAYDEIETVTENSDNIKIYLNINWKNIYDDNDNFHGVIGSIRDITKNKLLEEVKEYDKLKTEFFANVSHELRTPLNVINATLQLMDSYNSTMYFKDNPEKIGKYINVMKQNSYRLLRLFNNLIDLTKIESGFYALHLKNYNIINLIENIVLSIKHYTESKGIDLEFDTDVEELIMACDSEKIERVMLNLLSNAIKFTPRGGKVEVIIKTTENHISVSIKDTGIGIPKEELKSIFNRFMQVKNPYMSSAGGSGIGLSIVKSLVELHQGEINVNSELNEGTEFYFILPIKVVDGKEVILENSLLDMGEKAVNIELSDIV